MSVAQWLMSGFDTALGALFLHAGSMVLERMEPAAQSAGCQQVTAK